MPTDLLITNALIVTGDPTGTVIRDGAVAVEAGRIAWLGPSADAEPEARRVIDAGGMLLAPGLVNTHCHAGDSLFRGLVEDLPLEPWLRTVWKAEGAILDRDTVRLGATLGLAETLLGGVTTTMDMFWHPAETVAAARCLGVRVSTGGIFFDGPGIDGLTPGDRLAAAERSSTPSAAATTCCPAASRTAPTRSGRTVSSPPSASPTTGAGSSARTPPKPGPNKPSSWIVTAGR